MTISYTSPIAQQPLLGSQALSDAQGAFAPVANPTAATAAYPGLMVTPAQQAFLGSSYGNVLNPQDQAAQTNWQTNYDAQNTNLENAQNAAAASMGLAGGQYGEQALQQMLSQFNQARNTGMNSLDTLAQYLGLN